MPRKVVATVSLDELAEVIRAQSTIDAIDRTIDHLIQRKAEALEVAIRKFGEIKRKYGLDVTRTDYKLDVGTGEIILEEDD